MSARLDSLDEEIAELKANFANRLAELEGRRPQLIAEAIAEEEAKAAATATRVAALRASLAPAAPTAFLLPPAQLPAPAGVVKTIVVDYSQIPKGAQLMHIVGRVKEAPIESCGAIFHDSKNIVTPAGVRYRSIHAWAEDNMERNLEKLGRKKPNLNVFDKRARIFFAKGGEMVPLHAIQTVTRV
jgi:hypothetical protein